MRDAGIKGWIALILACSIGMVLVIGVAGAAFAGRELSDGAREVLVALGGAIVGALAGFLGARLNGHAG